MLGCLLDGNVYWYAFIIIIFETQASTKAMMYVNGILLWSYENYARNIHWTYDASPVGNIFKDEMKVKLLTNDLKSTTEASTSLRDQQVA